MANAKHVVTALLISVSMLAIQAQEIPLEDQFSGAISAAEKGDLETAVQLMEKVRAVTPDDSSVVWNLGTWNAQLERHEDALVTWRKARELEPLNWEISAKLIQAYQGLGQTAERDAERDALLKWYSKAKKRERPEQSFFCREQMTVADRKVIVLEFFDPAKDKDQVFYRFMVLGDDGDEEFWFSLGSYETITQISRQLGKIGKKDRLYHLDRYTPDGSHGTMGMYDERPSYDDVRERVVHALTPSEE